MLSLSVMLAEVSNDLWQVAAVLACVTGASAFLTTRWVLRRRRGCTGECSRCPSRGASTTACQPKPTTGLRPAGLQVLQTPPNLSPPADV